MTMPSKKKTMKMRFSGVALVALLAASCASVDVELLDAQLPDAPANWSAATSEPTAPIGDWVGSFNDSTLRALIDEAIVRNNTFRATVANFDQARANAKISRAALLPSLNASFNASRNAIVTDPTAALAAGGSATPTSGLSAGEIEDQFGVDTNGDGRLEGLDLDGGRYC